MPKNRYDDNLRINNQQIIDLTPSNVALKLELALELKKILQNQNNLKILEIGIGEGDLTKLILKNNSNINLDCLDISKEMIEISRDLLSDYSQQTNLINEDVLDYLNEINFKYDIILSSWTIHNFTQNDKLNTFKKIYSSLSSNGYFIMMDKVYTDDEEKNNRFFENQMKRYKYLPNKLYEEMLSHEKQDSSDDYVMNELKVIKLLNDIGFRETKIVDRVERDILLVAKK